MTITQLAQTKRTWLKTLNQNPPLPKWWVSKCNSVTSINKPSVPGCCFSSKKWLDWTITCGAVDLWTYLTLQWWARQCGVLPGAVLGAMEWMEDFFGFFVCFGMFFLSLLTLVFQGQLGLMTLFFLLPKLSFVSRVFEVMLQFVVVKLCFFVGSMLWDMWIAWGQNTTWLQFWPEH